MQEEEVRGPIELTEEKNEDSSDDGGNEEGKKYYTTNTIICNNARSMIVQLSILAGLDVVVFERNYTASCWKYARDKCLCGRNENLIFPKSWILNIIYFTNKN